MSSSSLKVSGAAPQLRAARDQAAGLRATSEALVLAVFFSSATTRDSVSVAGPLPEVGDALPALSRAG